ncbi:Elongation factor 1 gamma, conserved domain [Carpediemonas membranifera]|uniref:Elongation factor 1 gamma, conserved domain n=1 Tax=Carpediemonas membranifera TaxID=201153 RepID=A0A8J6BAK9_9EUKA|nr:Elongation factor 1 gamma, conserved domain [Carpediemonas membranifera]|eukprot:KAG9397579.1 Elongation factor 1 gamma, conserved domain [Carpediemonas membranifera]
MKLIAERHNPFVKYVEFVARYCEITFEIEYITTTQSSVLKRKNPLSRLPVLELDSIHPIFESDNIVMALAEMKPELNLLGIDFFTRCQVRQWLFAISLDLDTKMWPWLGPMLGIVPFNGAVVSQARSESIQFLTTVNEHLEQNTFVAGQRLSLADFALLGIVDVYFRHLLDAKVRSLFPAVIRHHRMMSSLQAYDEIYGDVKLCDKPPQPPRKAPFQKPKPPPPVHRTNEYLSRLPKPAFTLEEWKKIYEEKKGSDEAVMWLWAHLRPGDYSFWKCIYRYYDELEVGYKTANRCASFLEECEVIRPMAFGEMVITKDQRKPYFNMFGVFMIRGPDILPEFEKGNVHQLSIAKDFDFTELKIDSEFDRKMISDVFSWSSDDNFGGLGVFEEGNELN